ncbi:MAG TPA: CopD family protein, partial [Acetobacteraceae bacterium]
MSLLVDLFGYLSIIIHGLTIVAQSMTLGGVFFLLFLARSQGGKLGPVGDAILCDTARIAAYAALGLILCEAATVALESAVLVGTIDLSLSDVLTANFAIAGGVKVAAAIVLALLLFLTGPRAPAPLLLATGLVELAAATMTTHAAARLDDRLPLLAVSALHQLGAAIWIGGIPCFVSALARVHEAAAWRTIGARFSRMSMIGVACIIVSGAVMSLLYIGSWEAFYGTAYGVMVGAKIVMFLMLLGLGYGNYRTVANLRTDPGTSLNRMKRFAEIEIGIGFSVFFAAASLTSVPPAVDLTQDRVTWQEIAERNTPVWPRMTSPDHDVLALPALQAKLDAQAAARKTKPQPAFVP